jgi:hypothetical protein
MGFIKYVVEMELRCQDMHTKFRKEYFGHSKVEGGGEYTHTE